MARRKKPTSSRPPKKRPPLRFSRVNLMLGGAGLITLALGYFLLAQGSITAAPILLVLSYVVLIPLALIL